MNYMYIKIIVFYLSGSTKYIFKCVLILVIKIAKLVNAVTYNYFFWHYTCTYIGQLHIVTSLSYIHVHLRSILSIIMFLVGIYMYMYIYKSILGTIKCTSLSYIHVHLRSILSIIMSLVYIHDVTGDVEIII